MIRLYQILFYSGLLFSICTFLMSHIGGHADHGDGADASIDGADGAGEGIDFHGDGADFEGFDVHGEGADFEGFDVHGDGGDFEGFDVHGDGGDFEGFDVHGDGADFDGASADIHADGADLHADLHGHAHGSGTDVHDMEGHAHVHSSSASGVNLWGDWFSYLLPFRLSSLTLIATVSGGLGMILTDRMAMLPAALISFGSGYAVSSAIGLFILKPLRKSQNTSASKQRDVVGRVAVVTSTILEGGFGRIRYTVRGQTYNAPATHAAGKRVEQGEEVVVRRIERGAYYVTLPMEHVVTLGFGKEPGEDTNHKGGMVE